MAISHYFLGSPTPNGFVTPIKEILDNTDNTVYILKGTAGSGKSTLMKKISDAFSDCTQEIFHCSADPFSLDGVYIKEHNFLIMDGTSPHCFDPAYPKAVESIVDIGTYLNAAHLRANKDNIIKLTSEYSGFHKRCKLCLTAISSVTSDIVNAVLKYIDYDKLTGFTKRTVKRLIPAKNDKSIIGKISSRQLSAMTMNGYSTYLPNDYKIYLLSDSNLAASDIFLKSIAQGAVKNGYDIILSECLICADRYFEHILIPELKTAFITSSCINHININSDDKKIINFKRFYTDNVFNSKSPLKARLRFGKKAIEEFIAEASLSLKTAKSIHDDIEKYYIESADFDSLNRLTYTLISQIKSL